MLGGICNRLVMQNKTKEILMYYYTIYFFVTAQHNPTALNHPLTQLFAGWGGSLGRGLTLTGW